MFILPWFFKKTISQAGTVSYRFHLFLEKGGTQLISCEASAVASFCEENEIVSLDRFRQGSTEYVRVDETKTDLSAFYSFHEENTKDLEVWRTFLWIGTTETDDPWNTNKYFDDITLSKIRVSEILRTILRRVAKEE